MKRLPIFLAATIFSMTALAQTAIKLEDIDKHIGDSVKVCAKIYGGIFLDRSTGTPTLLNAGASYPSNPLTLVIGPDLRKEFTDKPEEFYKDKMVCVFGKLVLFKDKPQIVIYSKIQLQIEQ